MVRFIYSSLILYFSSPSPSGPFSNFAKVREEFMHVLSITLAISCYFDAVFPNLSHYPILISPPQEALMVVFHFEICNIDGCVHLLQKDDHLDPLQIKRKEILATLWNASLVHSIWELFQHIHPSRSSQHGGR
eukprot:m.106917 g.106917  ORF g.106917 m.106917 type:complete len:133 (-) comp9166_c0_seq1:873-1271(-)